MADDERRPAPPILGEQSGTEAAAPTPLNTTVDTELSPFPVPQGFSSIATGVAAENEEEEIIVDLTPSHETSRGEARIAATAGRPQNDTSQQAASALGGFAGSGPDAVWRRIQVPRIAHGPGAECMIPTVNPGECIRGSSQGVSFVGDPAPEMESERVRTEREQALREIADAIYAASNLPEDSHERLLQFERDRLKESRVAPLDLQEEAWTNFANKPENQDNDAVKLVNAMYQSMKAKASEFTEYKNEVKWLKDQVTTLQNQKLKLSNLEISSRDDINYQTKAKDKAIADLKDAKKAHDTEIARQKGEIRDHDKTVKEEQKKYAKARHDMETLRKSHEDKIKTLTEVWSLEKKQLEERLKTRDKNLEQCEKDKAELRASASAQVDDDKIREEMEEKDDKIKSLEGELHRLQEDHDRWTTVIDEMIKEKKEQENKLATTDELKQRIKDLSDQVSTLKDEADASQERIASLEENNKNNLQRLQKNASQMKDDAQNQTELQNGNYQLSVEVIDLKAEIVAHQKTIQGLQADAAAITRKQNYKLQIFNEKLQLESCRSKLEEREKFEETIATLSASEDGSEQTTTELAKEIVTLRAEVNRLKEELSDLNSLYEQASKDCETEKEKLRDRINRLLEEATAAGKTQAAEASEARTETETIVANSAAQVQVCEQEKAALNREIGELKDKLKEEADAKVQLKRDHDAVLEARNRGSEIWGAEIEKRMRASSGWKGRANKALANKDEQIREAKEVIQIFECQYDELRELYEKLGERYQKVRDGFDETCELQMATVAALNTNTAELADCRERLKETEFILENCRESLRKCTEFGKRIRAELDNCLKKSRTQGREIIRLKHELRQANNSGSGTGFGAAGGPSEEQDRVGDDAEPRPRSTPPTKRSRREESPLAFQRSAGSEAPSTAPGYSGPRPVVESVSFAILRCQANLRHMRDERAQHGFHSGDSISALASAKEVWEASQQLPEGNEDEMAMKEHFLARGAYMQGVAYFYANQVERARGWFTDAGARETGQYRAEIIDDWLHRISVTQGPSKEAAFYKDPVPAGTRKKKSQKGKQQRHLRSGSLSSVWNYGGGGSLSAGRARHAQDAQGTPQGAIHGAGGQGAANAASATRRSPTEAGFRTERTRRSLAEELTKAEFEEEEDVEEDEIEEEEIERRAKR